MSGSALFASVAVFAGYATVFSGGLSSSNADWGAFGDFFGGLLGPFFAILSMFLIAFSIRLTMQSVLDSNRNQAADRLYTLIMKLDEEVVELYSSIPMQLPQREGQGRQLLATQRV